MSRTFGTALAVAAVIAIVACSSKPAMVGKAAPDFTVKDSEHSVTLSQYRGRVVVLNFWATYCAPCVEELPSLQRMAAQMKSQNVAVLTISEDPDEQAYRNFLQKYHIELFSVRDAELLSPHLYGTTGIPESFIIDARGIVRRKFVGAIDWTKPEIIEYLTRLQGGTNRAAN
jgi:cytochrome c biogenesis protein CcmG/thiol:disulfide interchange protein DsbE